MAKRLSKIEKSQKRTLSTNGFYSDYTKDGSLYAVLIRSPAASGRVKKISIENLPENYFLYTASDFPGSKTMEYNGTSEKLFGFQNISYTGEPLGILIGQDENLLKKLLQDVNISFDVGSLESALKNVIKNRPYSTALQNLTAPEVQEKASAQNGTAQPQETSQEFSAFLEQINEMPSLDAVLDKNHTVKNPNVTVATREIKCGAYTKVSLPSEIEALENSLLQKDVLVYKNTWKQNLEDPKWKETAGAFCYMEGENLHIYTPTNWTFFLQTTVSKALNLPVEKIYVHKTKNTGIFSSSLWRTTQLAVQTALACYLSKKPVKLVLSSEEQQNYMKPGINAAFTYKTCLDSSGKIIFMNIELDIDIGSSNPFAQEITDRLCLACFNYYKIENLYVHAVTHTSKNPPTSISQNSVDTQAFFAIENQIQKLTLKSNFFPSEIRLINSREEKKSSFPFQIPFVNSKEVIEQLLFMSDFNRKYVSYQMDAIDRVEKDSKPFFALPLRGMGLSTAYNASGYYGNSVFSSSEKIQVTLFPDEIVEIHSTTPSEVIKEIWKSTASEILHVPKQNVKINTDYLLDELPKQPEISLSSIGILNEALKKACLDIQKKRFYEPLPITSKKGLSPAAKKSWNQQTFTGNPFNSTAFAATAVEVELDTYTFSETIKGIWIAIDCGILYDKNAALRSVQLEVQQELTMLVRGKNVNCQNIQIQFIESDNKPGQIGGLVHNTLPAAFASALSLALATELNELPCTEEQLFKLIKNREANTGL